MGNQPTKQIVDAKAFINEPKTEADFQEALSILQSESPQFVENTINTTLTNTGWQTNSDYNYDKFSHIAIIKGSNYDVVVFNKNAFGTAQIMYNSQKVFEYADRVNRGHGFSDSKKAEEYVNIDHELAKKRVAYYTDQMVTKLEETGFCPLYCGKVEDILDKKSTTELACLTKEKHETGDKAIKYMVGSNIIKHNTIYCATITKNAISAYTLAQKGNITFDGKALLNHVQRKSRHMSIGDFNEIFKISDPIYLYVVCYNGDANCPPQQGGIVTRKSKAKNAIRRSRYVCTNETAVIMCRSNNKNSTGLVKKTVRVYVNVKNGRQYRRVRCDDNTYKYVIIRTTY